MPNIQCPKCGEEYSDTYRKCPFCQEEEAIRKGKPIRRKGKRLEKKKNGGAGGVLLLLTLVIAAGVAGYVAFGQQLADWVGIRTEDNQDLQYQDMLDEQQNDQQNDESSSTEDEDTQTETDVPVIPDEPVGPLALSQSNITIPAGEVARLTTTGGAGEVIWDSSNINIATVDGGAVTGVAGGTVTITAKSGEETVSCTVTVTGDAWVNPVQLKLNKTDFTLRSGDPNVQMKVDGTESAPVWASSNTNVVTVSETGVVKRVGKGTVTVTATVDGQVLECIVRCP